MSIKPLFDESELLRRIAEGDQNAFRTVFETYYNKIYTYALRILGDDVLAEEIVQETMLKVWKIGSKLTGIHNIDTYLKTTAKHKAIDVLRRIANQRRMEAALAPEWKEYHNETEEQILLNDTRKVLKEAIALLPEQQRAVYELCHQEGLKYAEAAEKLNLSPETVKFYMKLALRFLRNYLSTHTDVAALIIIFKLL